MKITKEMIFDQFKDATKKDQSKKKETFTNRIEFLKTLKDDVQKNPKNFDISITQQQFQNLIDDWSTTKPIDAFYKRVFNIFSLKEKACAKRACELCNRICSFANRVDSSTKTSLVRREIPASLRNT